jgi:hypothetical protein
MSNRTKRLKLKPQSYCIFCISSGLSKEHFWSEWIGDLIKIPAPQGAVEARWTHRPNSPFPILESRRFRQGSTLSKKIRCVCERCNNEWMSEIESECKDVMTPLILGSKTTLDESNQLLVATWVTLKLFIAESGEGRQVISTQKERTAFMNERILPQGLQIFIGQCGRDGWEATFWRGADTIGTPWQKPRPPAPNIQCIAIGTGHLFIYALQCKAAIPFNIDPGERLFRIYPAQQTTLNWPPPKRLSSAEAGLLADTLGRFSAMPGVLRVP